MFCKIFILTKEEPVILKLAADLHNDIKTQQKILEYLDSRIKCVMVRLDVHVRVNLRMQAYIHSFLNASKSSQFAFVRFTIRHKIRI